MAEPFQSLAGRILSLKCCSVLQTLNIMIGTSPSASARLPVGVNLLGHNDTELPERRIACYFATACSDGIVRARAMPDLGSSRGGLLRPEVAR